VKVLILLLLLPKLTDRTEYQFNEFF